MNRILPITIVFLLLLVVCVGCSNKTDYNVGQTSIGRGYYVSIDEKEYTYLDDVRNAYDSTALLHFSLNAIDDTPDELLIDAGTYKIYQARGANGYEALVRVNNGSDTRELLRVVMSNFNDIVEMMSFFGINSVNDIVSCSFSHLVITTARIDLFYSHYESYITSDSEEMRKAVFNILSSLNGVANTSTSFSLLGREGAEPAEDMDVYSEWAQGVRKIDIMLTSGTVLPIAFSLSDGYAQVLDGRGYIAFGTELTAEIRQLIESII